MTPKELYKEWQKTRIKNFETFSEIEEFAKAYAEHELERVTKSWKANEVIQNDHIEALQKELEELKDTLEIIKNHVPIPMQVFEKIQALNKQ